MEEEKDKPNNFVGMHGEVIFLSFRMSALALLQGTLPLKSNNSKTKSSSKSYVMIRTTKTSSFY